MTDLLSLGELLIDFTPAGVSENGNPVFERNPGGGPANVACAAARLGAAPEETWVFEDAWHAIRTAKSAGFKTVAVYDKANDKNLGQIWNHADIYLPDLLNFNEFWSRASEM